MGDMKYKVGDKVRIKSIDWYNEHTLIDTSGVFRTSIESLCLNKKRFMGKELRICSVLSNGHYLMEETGVLRWTDEMIEGLMEDGTKPLTFIDSWECPQGYQFVDENGNVINAQKIALEKKKKEYPKTYEECCKVLGVNSEDFLSIRNIHLYNDEEEPIKYERDLLLGKFDRLWQLIICRDAYWKIAGEEMGLEKPWGTGDCQIVYGICRERGNIVKRDDYFGNTHTFEFPIREMRDAFYENFKELIEKCKALL